MKCLSVNILIILVYTNLLPFSLEQDSADRPEVTLSTGTVRGWRLPSKASQGTFLLAFKGIPYATPPLNQLRFMVGNKWFKYYILPKTFQPHKNKLLLYQLEIGMKQEICRNQTPCLVLKIRTRFQDLPVKIAYSLTYTLQRGVNSSSLLPVMVWIHGGAFVGGSSSSAIYGGDYLVEQGIVFVTLNYRLGALGFLNLGSAAVPGNAGLKDQNLALQWIKKEISNFGGDPNKVTIFGQSAGSASVIMHYLSPKSAGLFRSAIAESGNAFAEWAFMSTGFDERAKALSEKLNCTTTTGEVNLTCLQEANVVDVIKYQDLLLTDNEYVPGNGFVFVPTLENASDSAILSDTPVNLLASLLLSNRSKVPLLTGVNKDEGLGEIKRALSYYKQYQEKLKYFIPESIRNKKTDEQIKEDVASINNEYFQNIAPSPENMEGFIKLYTDKMFTLNTGVFAREITNATDTDTYLYQFDYDGGFKQQHTLAIQMNYSEGVDHGDEMGYIFVREDLNQSSTAENTTEKRTLRKMVKLWTNFAKYGNPTPNTTGSVLGNLTWIPIREGATHYMRVTADVFAMSSDNFHEETVSFWSKLESITSFATRQSCSWFLILIFSVVGNIIYRYFIEE